MPDRYLKKDITKEERSAFFHMLELGFLRTTALVSLCISIMVAVAISIPVAIIIDNNTSHVNVSAHNTNCHDVNAIDNALIGVIVKSPQRKLTKEQITERNDLLSRLNAAHCKLIQ